MDRRQAAGALAPAAPGRAGRSCASPRIRHRRRRRAPRISWRCPAAAAALPPRAAVAFAPWRAPWRDRVSAATTALRLLVRRAAARHRRTSPAAARLQDLRLPPALRAYFSAGRRDVRIPAEQNFAHLCLTKTCRFCCRLSSRTWRKPAAAPARRASRRRRRGRRRRAGRSSHFGRARRRSLCSAATLPRRRANARAPRLAPTFARRGALPFRMFF